MAKKQIKSVKKSRSKATNNVRRKAKVRPARKSSLSNSVGRKPAKRKTPVSGGKAHRKNVVGPAKKGKTLKPVSKAPGKVASKTVVKTTPKGGPSAKLPAATPATKPSAGEIAARLSARRTEKALAEGKAKSGRNGGVELRKVELTPAEAEARKTRLKNLIVLGRRGCGVHAGFRVWPHH